MMGKKINNNYAGKLIAKGAILIDVRDPVSFRDGTLPGAINITTCNVSRLMTWDKNSKLIFFGNSSQDSDLKTVLKYAHQLRFNNIFYLDDITDFKLLP